MKRITGEVALLVFLLAFSCKDDDGVKFEGIDARDSNNQFLGTIGKRDINDWDNDGTLGKQVLDLLAKTPDLDLTGTGVTGINIAAYPNPVKNFFKFSAELANEACLLEYVIVNEKMKVLYSGSQREAFGFDLSFDVSDRSKFPLGSIVRMYYSFSAEGNANFFVGHGDIKICDVAAQDNCFQ